MKIINAIGVQNRLSIKLHQNQQIISDSPAVYKVCKCGKRFGKTKWALYELARAAGKKINGTFWGIWPTYSMAEQIGWHELKKLIPRQFMKRCVENKLLIELEGSGSIIQLKGAENQDALRGSRLHGVVLDEAAYIDEYAWQGIISNQLLGTKDEGRGFAYFISSPNSKGRNWYTSFHQEAQRKMDAGDKDWAAFYFTIYDNPLLSEAQLKQEKENVPESTWDLEFMAIESAHAGQIYSEFNYNDHVKEIERPAGELVRAIDWGINHPTVCLWAYVDRNKKSIYISDEYVRSDKSIPDSCAIIKSMTGSRSAEWTVIDPTTNKRDPNNPRTSNMGEFARAGITCIPGDNRERGYDITKMFLKRNMITISPRCKTLILELKNVQWGEDINDDCADSLRYMCTRINDFMFDWRDVVPVEKEKRTDYTEEYLKERREMNFNNRWIFPDAPQQQMSWLQEEILSEL